MPCVVYETEEPMQARKMVIALKEAGVAVEDDITGTVSDESVAGMKKEAPFEFYIEHVICPAGKQYAARGYVLNGEICVGEAVILPKLREQTFQSRVLSIENSGRAAASAKAGESVVLELEGVMMHQIGIHGVIRKPEKY